MKHISHVKTVEDVKTEMENPLFKLSHCLMPKEVRDHKRIINDGEVEYAMRWIGFFDDQNKVKDDVEVQLCVRQLGLLSAPGQINQDRASLIADYLWSLHPAEPNFAQLLSWLRDHHPLPGSKPIPTTQGMVSPFVNNSKFIKKQSQKKKKMLRKRRKSSRKR